MKVFSFKHRSTLYKFISAFLLIMVLCLISYILFYRNSYDFIKKNIVESEMSNISRMAQDMDSKIYDLHMLIYNLKKSSTMMQLDAKGEIGYGDFATIMNLSRQYVSSNSFIEDILFYLPLNNAIICSTGSYSFDTYFDKYLFNKTRNKYFWQDYLNKSSKAEILSADTYKYSIFPDKTETNDFIALVSDKYTLKNIRIIVLINTVKIKNLYGDNLAILKESGETLYGNINSDMGTNALIKTIAEGNVPGYAIIPVSNVSQYVFYIKSPAYLWYYIKAVPYSSILSQLDSFNRFAAITVVSIMLICLLLSGYFSFRFYSPIKKIVDMIAPSFKEGSGEKFEKNEIQWIYNHIQYIDHNYEHIENKYNKMQGIYKEYFYERLIKNINTDNCAEILNELKIDQDDFRDFLVVHYKINFKSDAESPDSDSAHTSSRTDHVIKALIDPELEGQKSYSFQIDMDSYITIVTLKKENFSNEAFISSIRNILSQDSEHLYIICSVSNIYHNINKLKAAYDDALNLFTFHSLKEENQFLLNEPFKSIVEYIIPNRLSNKISSSIELSLFDRLEGNLLEALDYFEAQNIPAHYIRRNFIGIFNDIINSLRKKPVARLDLLNSIYNNIDLCSTKGDFKNLLLSLCEFINTAYKPGKEVSTGNQTVDRMVSYIQGNFHEDIHLDLLADKFKMSPIYLSKIFKDYTGINFSDFLNQSRLEKAKDLLRQSDIKIKDLSAQIGFRDVNIFIKAFKKYFGISPGEYRKSINIL